MNNDSILKFLYNKKIECPVCGNKFNVKAIKSRSYKMKSKDSDFFIRYDLINPYFYDVWLCQSCGYAAMKLNFNKINSNQVILVKKNIASKWHSRDYPEIFDVDIAIERYKLSLINYYCYNANSSIKALNLLKIAWMYRLKEDTKNEMIFLEKALKEFETSFYNENLKTSFIDEYTMMYLIGELNRRLENTAKASLWFGKVITSPGINHKIKELAREQHYIIKNKK